MQAQNGQTIPVVIVDANDATITLDANHPLAGQDLTFAIELVSIDAA
jgi:peptidylprolyl isomerase